MKLNQIRNENIELGDNSQGETNWFIVRSDGKISSGPYNSKQEANSDTKRLQWFTPSEYSIEFGVDDNGLFVNSETGEIGEDCQMPDAGCVVRTKKSQTEGTVEKVENNEVFFRTQDGRLLKTPFDNVTVIEQLADDNTEMFESRIDELSTEKLAKYKTAAAKDSSASDKKGDYEKAHKRFKGVVKATIKQFDNDKKKKIKENSGQAPGMFEIYNTISLEPVNHPFEASNIQDAFIKADDWLEAIGKNGKGLSVRPVKPQNEGSMGGINRAAPAQDVSYEHMLDEVLNELSLGTLQNYKDKVSSTDTARHRAFGKLPKGVEGNKTASRKINAKLNQPEGMLQTHSMHEDASPEEIAKKLNIRSSDIPAIYALMNGKIKFNDLPQPIRFALFNKFHDLPQEYGEEGKTSKGMLNFLHQLVAENEMDESITPWGGYTSDDKKKNALAKAPKSSMQGSTAVKFSDMVKDTIDTHGVKWAFEYYVLKHGLPPRQFRIFAGI